MGSFRDERFDTIDLALARFPGDRGRIPAFPGRFVPDIGRRGPVAIVSAARTTMRGLVRYHATDCPMDEVSDSMRELGRCACVRGSE